MNNIALTTLFLAVSILPSSLKAENKVIYGDDDRLEYFEAPAAQRRLADSVVSLWQSWDLTREQDGYKLRTAKFADAVGVCEKEPFSQQPIGAFCSGALVGEDLVMTAGHCIRNQADCADTMFVFGFRNDESGTAPDRVPASDVYACAKIEKWFLRGSPTPVEPGTAGLGADYALIRIDRKAAGRTPLPVNRGAVPAKGAPLFVIGHPVGLPLKVAGGAAVRDSYQDGYFVANLDTYGGNSGSPVFNRDTNLIEGILVRGETDFVYEGNCRVSYRVADDGGRGEDVTKVSELAEFIPRSEGEPDRADLTAALAGLREVNLSALASITGSLAPRFLH
ncbi:MAG: periplasmic protease [Elusimicrobia bacterium]|nr:MAG: periplasmic protease [Elusimicrobiota bacterium]KAF0155877.1 MAG: periplasmic protease [Elusimicrobiota bacterium]